MSKQANWTGLLFLGCFLFQTNSMEISMSSKEPVAFKTQVELKCINRISDTGVYWFLQKRDYTTHFILYVSTRSKITAEGVTDYQASKNGDYYHLAIRSFEERHQGIYYCLSHRNQVLQFSAGLQLYVPGKLHSELFVQSASGEPLCTMAAGQAALSVCLGASFF